MQEGEQLGQVSSSIQPVQKVNLWLGFATCTSCEWLAKFPCLLKIVTFRISITYTIYTLITHRNDKEPIERKIPKKGFYNTPTLWEKELLILREKSLYSFLLSSSIDIPIERRFVLKHNLHPFRVLRVFLELRKHWKMPRMVDAIWNLLRDPEN